jgi:hypothetical protein
VGESESAVTNLVAASRVQRRSRVFSPSPALVFERLTRARIHTTFENATHRPTPHTLPVAPRQPPRRGSDGRNRQQPQQQLQRAEELKGCVRVETPPTDLSDLTAEEIVARRNRLAREYSKLAHDRWDAVESMLTKDVAALRFTRDIVEHAPGTSRSRGTCAASSFYANQTTQELLGTADLLGRCVGRVWKKRKRKGGCGGRDEYHTDASLLFYALMPFPTLTHFPLMAYR